MASIAIDIPADTSAGQLSSSPPASDSIVRRHLFIVPFMLEALFICGWFATFGDWHLFADETFCGFYDAQARALMAGRLDVPRDAIGFEAFSRDGKTYGYFGIGPALLRLPLVSLFPTMDGRWSRSMLLAGCLANLICAYRICCAIGDDRTRRGRRQKLMLGLFILCAGVGSTNVFLASRSYVYHEAIMWGSAFALLFVDRMLAYLKKPTVGTLVLVGVFAFMSMQSRVTIGAGTVMGLGSLTMLLAVRAVRESRAVVGFGSEAQGKCAGDASAIQVHGSEWSLTPGPSPQPSPPNTGEREQEGRLAVQRGMRFLVRWAYSPTDRVARPREDGGQVRPPYKRATRAVASSPIRNNASTAVRSDPEKSTPHVPASTSNRSAFGLAAVARPLLHALVAGLFVALALGVYLGINYAKFRTLDGMPVRLYGRFSETPVRMAATDGKQLHFENLPTGFSSYFGLNVLEIGPEFPWVYMDHAPRMIGSPSIDLVERYSSIVVCMPALFLLMMVGWHPIVVGQTAALRRLRLPTLAVMLGGGIFLMGVGITQRYIHDLYPFLLLAGAAGLWRIMSGSRVQRDAVALLGLTLVSVTLNCAFAYDFQREVVWGVPKEKRAELVRIRENVDRIVHREAVTKTED